MLVMSWAGRAFVIGLGLAGTAALTDSSAQGPPALGSPAPVGSFAPQLTHDQRGRVLLSWLETRSAGGHRFRFATLDGTAWSPATTIAEGDNFFANWADVLAV
jgi:hypothetical protein